MCVLGQPGELDRPAWAGVCVSGLTSAIPPQPWRSGWWCVRKAPTGLTKQEISCAYLHQLGVPDWLVLAHLLDSSHRTHFPGLLRRARLRELISRAYLAELIDPNSADEDVLNSSFNSYEPDVLNSSSEDVFRTSSTHPIRTSSTHLPKTHSRHLQLISQRRPQLVFRSSSQDVFAG